MNSGEAYMNLESQFNLSISENLSLSNGHLFRFEKNSSQSSEINNYLKTPEEMEAEFCFVINTRKAAFEEKDDSLDSYNRLKLKTDGYMNIHRLEETFSGFMEENY
jgi:hypothetical protein